MLTPEPDVRPEGGLDGTPAAPDAARVSSTISTGSGGAFFEQHVGAYWLTHLLVRGFAPILHRSVVTEVEFQTERLGWQTDDFLVLCESGDSVSGRLLGQVKRSFTVSSRDKECRKAVIDFWRDFNSDDFDRSTDRLVLVVLRGTNVLLDHFSGLLDVARTARDGAEFESRLLVPGLVNRECVRKCGELETIITEADGALISRADIWPFLRTLHVLSLDLNTSTAQHEALAKSLLTATSSSGDPDSAVASWNELLRVASRGMEDGASLRRGDLPEQLLQGHSAVGGSERAVLAALSAHSDMVANTVQSTLGGQLHLHRHSLVQSVLEQTDAHQVVLITGPAGSGKSVIAKDVLGILAEEHYTFVFRAEEFARPHLDETLASGQVPANASALAAILASQDKKVMFVESVERLLEKTTRDAFADLLTLTARDQSWRLVLTCRDYSTDLVRASLLTPAGIDASVVVVPSLSDDELDEVQTTFPTLSRPLAEGSLRSVLRNPYFLDKAMQIRWDKESRLPESEREFRTLFWSQVVRTDDRRSGGMPQRREDAFVQVALRRARALSAYVLSTNLDAESLESLLGDSLLITGPRGSSLVAPAHDVLEDWAILRWIERQYLECEESAERHAGEMGSHPAVRRTYRKWVAELVETDGAGAGRLFEAALTSSTVPLHTRDDMLVALLMSPSAPAFLEAHAPELLTDGKALLLRIIHLLRVACVAAPAWLGGARASLFNVPAGPAWPAVLQLVEAHIDSFVDDERPLLLGLIEDWGRGVAWWSPYPEGASSAAEIGWWLLPSYGEYWADEQRKRVLQVIAKAPNVSRERFIALLEAQTDRLHRDRASEDFRELLLEGLDGMPAARDLPDVLVRAASNHLLCTDDGLEDDWRYSGGTELETLFGVRRELSHAFHPASALHGPYYSLLRFHPRVGTDFIVDVFNHSADWYAHPRVRSVEPPFEFTLVLEDGSERRQWGNGRLWNLYRGTSVGPEVLQSLLMAFEKWLLEAAKQGSELDAFLVDVLRKSHSAALTAVVASVATAFPHLSGEALLVLLQSPTCIRLDRQRLANEAQTPSRIAEILPGLPRDEVYRRERKEADALPHRLQDLESAIMKLQLGPLRDRVHDILDRHRAALPPLDEQDEHDRVWRLALHRMDLRQYEAGPITSDADSDSEVDPEGERHGLLLTLQIPDADLAEMAEEAEQQHQETSNVLGLLHWAHAVFSGDRDTTHDPALWHERLLQAQALRSTQLPSDVALFSTDGVGIVAAVCVRDHWHEMPVADQLWCADVVCSEVERHADCWDQTSRIQRFSLSADRSCAWVLPLLTAVEEIQSRAHIVMLTALTHPVEEVRWYAAWGTGANLWVIDGDVAMRCVDALALEASIVQQAYEAEMTRSYDERRQVDELERAAAEVVRGRFFDRGIPEGSYRQLDVTSWFGAEANARILAILSGAPTERTSIEGFARAAEFLVAEWDTDQSREERVHHQRNYENESTIARILEDFLLDASPALSTEVLRPILEAVDRHSRDTAFFLIGLIGAEDRKKRTEQFWSIWRLFAEKVQRASWLEHLDREYALGSELISAIFLGSYWKGDVTHWGSLEGHIGEVDDLFEALPPVSVVLDDYVRFLHQIGSRSLPAAFRRVATQLKAGDATQMLSRSNTVFLLELLLGGFVYGRPAELKSDRELRDAILFLLDTLVERGSSAAFRMRDDFVTPIVND